MSNKPHGRDCPDRCSICLGVTPRKVEQDLDVILIDGKPVRAIASPTAPMRQYQQRGGRRR